MNHIPDAIADDIRKARRLEWWTLFWQLSIVVVMFFVMGSSQAMKSAWIEDILGLIPASVFLYALHLEQKPPQEKYPWGFQRTNSLAFLASSAALLMMGLWLAFESARKLVLAEHPTMGPMLLFGETMWVGWPMIAALAYSIVPPVILGRMKLPIARRIRDKVLHTDAQMQKADWMTGVAAIVGILGVGWGLWWADSAAALLIALDIVHDGVRASRTAAAELSDGMPRALGSSAISDDALQLRDHLRRRFPGANIRLRETGRYMVAEVQGVRAPSEPVHPSQFWPGEPDRKWRLADISFAPGGSHATVHG